NRRPHQLYTSLAVGLLSLLILIPVNGILFGNFVAGTLVSLLDAVIAILFVWLSERNIPAGTPIFSIKKARSPTTNLESTENQNSSPPALDVDNPNKMKLNVPRGFAAGLGTFLMRILRERVAFAVFSGLLDGLLVQLLIGPVYSWVHGLFYATFYVVLGKL